MNSCNIEKYKHKKLRLYSKMHIVLLENQKNKICVEKETSVVYLHGQLVASMTSTINNVERRHWQNQLRIT